jgi:hypothetical protein
VKNGSPKGGTEKHGIRILEKESPVVEVKDTAPVFSCYYTPPDETPGA